MEISYKTKHRLPALVWLTAFAIGSAQAWADRYFVGGDGISYLDIGDAFWRGDWATATNAYWAPLYAVVLGLAVRISEPAGYWEAPIVHLVNLGFFGMLMLTGELLLTELRNFTSFAGRDAGFAIPEWAWAVAGRSLLAWSGLSLISVQPNSPDMLVAALVYFAAALALRIRMGQCGWSASACLGLTLGLAYLAKAAMLPIGAVFLITVWFPVRARGGNSRAALIALVAFAAVAGPWIVGLSMANGYWTFGQSGKLNYAWMVNGTTPYMHWQGSEESGTPIHSTRIISTDPVVYEFAQPVHGTYPPWFDPS